MHACATEAVCTLGNAHTHLVSGVLGKARWEESGRHAMWHALASQASSAEGLVSESSAEKQSNAGLQLGMYGKTLLTKNHTRQQPVHATDVTCICYPRNPQMHRSGKQGSKHSRGSSYLESGVPSENAGKKSSALPRLGCMERPSWSKWVQPPSSTSFR